MPNGVRTVRTLIVRGGTSKALVILRNELPRDPALRDKVILSLYGSPDIRQIDGLGGAANLTSKLAIIGPPTREDADIDYLFGQVMIENACIDYNANCGNISSSIGVCALYHGFIDPTPPVTKVRIHQVNTRSIINAEIPVDASGRARIDGDYAIDGVPGTGARIDLDFSDAAGAILHRGLLPTGKLKETMRVEGLGNITVSFVDAANLVAFIHADEVGLTGSESIFELEQNKELTDRLQLIRGTAAEYLGWLKSWRAVDFGTYSNPYLIMVREPVPYKPYTFDGLLKPEEYDVWGRLYAGNTWHRAFPGTGTVATGIAAKLPGTVVHGCVAEQKRTVRIGHPAGVIDIDTEAERVNDEWTVKKATFGRTSRILLDGRAFIRPDIPDW